MSTEMVMLSNHLILCHTLLLLPSIFPSIRGLSSESVVHIKRPKYWSFNFSFSIIHLPMNNQGWFPSGLTGLISLLPKGLSRVFSSTTIWKHQFFGAQLFYVPTLTSVHWIHTSIEKTIDLTMWIFVSKVMSSLCNMLSRFLKAFLKGTLLQVSEVAQSCPTLCDPMGCSLPGSSVHGIFQARVLGGLPFPSPGDLPDPGVESWSQAL